MRETPRRIAWKVTPGTGSAYQVLAAVPRPPMARLSSLPVHVERGSASRLVRWILDADAIACAYGLRLPGVTI